MTDPIWGKLSLVDQSRITPLAIWMADRAAQDLPTHGSGHSLFEQPLPVWSALGVEHVLSPEHSFQLSPLLPPTGYSCHLLYLGIILHIAYCNTHHIAYCNTLNARGGSDPNSRTPPPPNKCTLMEGVSQSWRISWEWTRWETGHTEVLKRSIIILNSGEEIVKCFSITYAALFCFAVQNRTKHAPCMKKEKEHAKLSKIFDSSEPWFDISLQIYCLKILVADEYVFWGEIWLKIRQ